MSKRETVRSAGSVYLENFVAFGAGYIYWLIMSKITSTEVIGTSSALISAAAILSVIASLAIPTGLQRFIAKTYLNGNVSDTRTYVNVSLLLMTAGILCAALVALYAQQWILGSTVPVNLVYISIILIASTSLTSLTRSIIVSSLRKSSSLPLFAIISTVCKIMVGVFLVLIGFGSLGLMIGFTISPVLTSIGLGFISWRLLRSTSSKELTVTQCLRDIISSSVSTWVPLIVNTIGSHLGTIVVFGSQGADKAAVYFIALSMVLALVTLMSAMFSVAYPVLSAMKDGRKRLAWRAIRMALVISSPLSMGIFWFSFETLSIFGQEYARGVTTLQILLLSVVPTMLSTGITTLMYSYGNYRHVMSIGLASNIPRPLLYILLVPLLNDTGAALSYTIGSLVGLVFAVQISRKVGLKLFWKEICVILLVPAAIGIVFKLAGINFIAGILSTLILSVFAYLFLKVLRKDDIRDSLLVFPPSITNHIVTILNVFSKKRTR